MLIERRPELRQRLVHRARAEALEVERDVGEAGRLAERDDLRALLDGERQRVALELEPRDGVVKAHAQLAEAEVVQPLLEAIDLRAAAPA